MTVLQQIAIAVIVLLVLLVCFSLCVYGAYWVFTNMPTNTPSLYTVSPKPMDESATDSYAMGGAAAIIGAIVFGLISITTVVYIGAHIPAAYKEKTKDK